MDNSKFNNNLEASFHSQSIKNSKQFANDSTNISNNIYVPKSSDQVNEKQIPNYSNDFIINDQYGNECSSCIYPAAAFNINPLTNSSHPLKYQPINETYANQGYIPSHFKSNYEYVKKSDFEFNNNNSYIDNKLSIVDNDMPQSSQSMQFCDSKNVEFVSSHTSNQNISLNFKPDYYSNNYQPSENLCYLKQNNFHEKKLIPANQNLNENTDVVYDFNNNFTLRNEIDFNYNSDLI